MLKIRKAGDRGVADFGWLNSHHTFSFGQYFDPDHMGFGPLRVINDDRVQGGGGFATHSHRDMEIISYVIEGALEHKDSIGTGSVIKPGDVQRMSAGTGISHSEYNHSATDGVHFLQIWIVPESKGLAPSYEQKHFEPSKSQGKLRLVGSRDGRDGSITIHQDLDLYVAHLSSGKSVNYALGSDRQAWLQVVSGSITLDDQTLTVGDGAAIAQVDQLTLHAIEDETEVLLFDLAAA